MVQNIPVGIYNNEIFIACIEDGVLNGFDVIRLVSTAQLDDLRDRYEREDEYKDLWKEMVKNDKTELGFSDWLDDVWYEEFDEDDEEDFPGKDSSFLDYLSEEDREAADKFLETQDIEVGTWEASGCYAPVNNFRKENNVFTGWQFVFDNDEARKWAERYADSVK
jgi:hypothetical protein